MARYGMAPQEGHLNATKRILGYLHGHIRRSLSVMMHNYPTSQNTRPPHMIGFGAIRKHKRCSHTKCLKPRGQPVKLWGYFDASHASCPKTRQSVTGTPPIHQQLSNPLVLQKAEYSGNFDIWIGTHCWKDSGGVRYQLQVQTTHAGSSLLTDPLFCLETTSP